MLKTKLQADQITALKAKDQIRLDTIRYIVSQIKNKEINTQKELTEEEVVQVLQKVKKELNESIDSFTKGGRTDLVDEYKKQLEVLTTYLPAELSDEELETEVAALISQNKTLFEQNAKALMGISIKALKSKADPSRILKMLAKLTPKE